MKFTSIFVGALATLAAAAPAPKEAEEKRSFLSGGFNQFSTGLQFGNGFDVLGANNFAFNNLNIAYLAAFNGFQNNIFSNLIVNQGLAFDPFADLFNFGAGQNFLQLNHILGLQSALVFSWLGNAGLINGVNFAGGAVPFLDFGNLGGFISPFSQFNLGIDQVITTQITSFVDGTGLFAGQLGGFGGIGGGFGGIGFKE
jgi:hypothetical protein